jgi:hypothetical protein
VSTSPESPCSTNGESLKESISSVLLLLLRLLLLVMHVLLPVSSASAVASTGCR